MIHTNLNSLLVLYKHSLIGCELGDGKAIPNVLLIHPQLDGYTSLCNGQPARYLINIWVIEISAEKLNSTKGGR